MRDLVFVEPSTTTLPRHRQSTLAIAAGMHIVLFAVLVFVKAGPVAVSAAGSPYARIAAYVAPAARAAGTPKPAPAAAPKQTAPAMEVAQEAPKEDQIDAGSAAEATAVVGGQPTAGPVRIGSGTLALLKKVSPIYPPVMQTARVPGVVVLDAVIHSDGTIGDITVLRSTNDAFARAAIEAVKKWRYTPPGYEGIVTVTVNFTLT